MAVVVAEDVAAGVLTKWTADTGASGCATLVTGGLHYQTVRDEATDTPYAVMMVEDGEQEDFSGTAFIKTFVVRIDCYSSQPTSNLAIRRALATLFDRASALTITNATMLTVKPVGGKLEITTERRNASDVVLATGAWEILVQGSR